MTPFGSSLVLAVACLLMGLAPPAETSQAAQPVFRGTVSPITASLRGGMTSWRRGCPVAIRDLRLLTLTHWGFDGRVHTGKLVVHEREAASVLRAMRGLFAARFPIRRMRLVEAYGSDDDRSMAADNTSGFNCRRVPGSTSWSAHAYGLAVDVNPLENPEIVGGKVLPPAGAAFRDRSLRRRGMIHAGDAVVRAFAAIGWRWGGYWRSLKDYQHFSATGR
jgi:hypothetical protein